MLPPALPHPVASPRRGRQNRARSLAESGGLDGPSAESTGAIGEDSVAQKSSASASQPLSPSTDTQHSQPSLSTTEKASVNSPKPPPGASQAQPSLPGMPADQQTINGLSPGQQLPAGLPDTPNLPTGLPQAEPKVPPVRPVRQVGKWLQGLLPDLAVAAVLGSAALAIHAAGLAPRRMFPVSDGLQIGSPDFAYPGRQQIILAPMAGLLAHGLAFLVILVMQIRVRSLHDFNNAAFGLLNASLMSSFFCVFLKLFIGGLRPNFYDVCQPDRHGREGQGFQKVMFDATVCTGPKNVVANSLQSFPSGHAATYFVCAVYSFLYLNAKMKIWADYHTAFWKVVAAYVPILLACLASGLLIIDFSHNWYDIMAGAMIGTIMAVSCYRTSFAAVWDYRLNHIPQRRKLSVNSVLRQPGMLSKPLVFTRSGLWGQQEALLTDQVGLPVNTSSLRDGHRRQGLAVSRWDAPWPFDGAASYHGTENVV